MPWTETVTMQPLQFVAACLEAIFRGVSPETVEPSLSVGTGIATVVGSVQYCNLNQVMEGADLTHHVAMNMISCISP